MNKTIATKLVIPVAAATTLAVSTLAACGGQTSATSAVGAGQTSGTGTVGSTVVSSVTSSGGRYADGTYKGSSVTLRWGAVQVEAVIQGGKITNVEFLSYPTDARSQQINSQAAPMLVREAIRAQSADVNVISGATYTSRAFMESLNAALSEAAA